MKDAGWLCGGFLVAGILLGVFGRDFPLTSFFVGVLLGYGTQRLGREYTR
jgi:hypothetical protein